MNPTVLATVNQKGGVAKTTSCINIGAAMARKGKKVLLVDTDPQASMTISLGNQQPDQLAPTIADLMTKVMNDIPIAPGEGILHHPEGIDLLPANIALAGTEVSLVNAMSRETILKQVLACNRQDYDCIIIDCMPSLGMLTINALARANDAVKLAYCQEPTEDEIRRLDLGAVAEFRRSNLGSVEIRFIDRVKALQALAGMLEGEGCEAEEFFRAMVQTEEET